MRRRRDLSFLINYISLLLQLFILIGLISLFFVNHILLKSVLLLLTLVVFIMVYFNCERRWRRLSRRSQDTAAFAKKLTALANGQRNVNFHVSGESGFSEIAQAADLLQYELDRNERERIRWSQDITHDLRTPITAMKIQIEGMRDGILDTTPERYDLLFKEMNELEIMLSDFSLLNKIETPDMVLQMEWLYSEEIMNTLWDRFNILAEKSGLRLKADWDTFYFKADSSLFIRAASNLIQNALSYSSAGSDVNLSFKLYENMMQLIVENPGNIPEEELPLLFQRLYRGETSRNSSGSGLGLTIAKTIAQLHSGDIQAMNSNRGTTLFIMTINMVLS